MSDTDALGQFTTSVPAPPPYYDPEYLERELNEIKKDINEIAQAVWVETDGRAVADRTEPGATDTTVPYAIDDEMDLGKRFTNVGATGPVSFQLPASSTVQEYEFVCDVSYPMYIWPQSDETHLGQTDGYALKIAAARDLVRVGCIVAGTWPVLSQLGSDPTYISFIPDADGDPLLDAAGYPIPGV